MLANIATALLAVVIGVLGAVVLFWILNKLTELLPRKAEIRLKPWAFLLPSLAAIALALIYPTILTVNDSLLNADLTKSVGLSNYTSLIHNGDFHTSLLNNLLWIIFAPAIIVALGMGIAIITDRIGPTREKIAKSIIFLPMAISAVAASAIWYLMYAYQPAGSPQVGLLNEIVVKLGGSPVSWLQASGFRANTFLLMVVYIWLQAGYAMVMLSAAIKAVPADTIEAGRIDGASEAKIFFRIIVPQAWPTVITVFITVLIGVMKLFDVVFVMTSGQFKTNVIGVMFYNEMFTYQDQGTASAIVVVLIICIVPVMVYQVRQFRKQEAAA